MSRQQLEHLLQECLEGFDAGLSPEECLSAYPHVRAELEPMLRQALSLRFAFAAAPSEEFKRRGRETLLFHAGRDVKKALSKEPDPEFVMDARQRFLSAAGAQAQEALRDVPPPRLPFWMNARRRLLDAAASPAPQPARSYTFAMRSAMSAAVIMLAIGVATLGFFLSSNQAGSPGASRVASANIDYIEETLDEIERQRAQGIPASASVLTELTNRTTAVAAQIAAGEVEGPLAARVPALIERQQEIVNTAVVTSAKQEPELVEAATRLEQAEVQVATARETPVPTSTTGVAVLGPTTTASPRGTVTPTAQATQEPKPTGTAGPSPTVAPVELEPGQVLVAVDPKDKLFATESNPLPWQRVTTSDITFLIASDWKIDNIEIEDGLAVIGASNFNVVTGSPDVPAVIVKQDGEVIALINGRNVQLRSEKGKVMAGAELLELLPNPTGLKLLHFLESIEVGSGVEDSEDEN
jgi:hypothetical protein